MPRSESANQHIRDDRRRAILRAAALQFATTGFAGTQVTDIAEAAHMSKGLLYHYFDSKAALFSALVDQIAAGVEHLVAEAESRAARPSDRLGWFIGEAVAGAENRSTMFPVLLQAIATEAAPRPARERVAAMMERTWAAMTHLLTEGQELGEFRAGDPESLARVLGACLQGHALGAPL